MSSVTSHIQSASLENCLDQSDDKYWSGMKKFSGSSSLFSSFYVLLNNSHSRNTDSKKDSVDELDELSWFSLSRRAMHIFLASSEVESPHLASTYTGA